MSCTNPKPAWKYLKPDGKYKIKFISHFDTGDFVKLKEKYGDDLVMIPCGKCDHCIEQRTKSWAVRCCLEASLYDDNCFVTLTYKSSCLPKYGLSKSDLQKFIKSLRNKYGEGIRYFACGEYGSHTTRAHYHLILFNFFPKDAKVEYPNPYGGFYYSSKELSKLWSLGFVSVGEVSYNSCAYVARYCQKKIKDYGKDFGLINQNPEFSLMSLRPGIGYQYFEKHYESLIDTNLIYFQIGDQFKHVPSRYFDKLIEKVNPDRLKELKQERISKANDLVAASLLEGCFASVEDYLFYQQAEKAKKYNRLKRRI